jgi:hypothetical protein
MKCFSAKDFPKSILFIEKKGSIEIAVASKIKLAIDSLILNPSGVFSLEKDFPKNVLTTTSPVIN